MGCRGLNSWFTYFFTIFIPSLFSLFTHFFFFSVYLHILVTFSLFTHFFFYLHILVTFAVEDSCLFLSCKKKISLWVCKSEYLCLMVIEIGGLPTDFFLFFLPLFVTLKNFIVAPLVKIPRLFLCKRGPYVYDLTVNL